MPQQFGQSQSPEVQSFGQVPPQEQAEQMFKDGFTQAAYSVLYAKFPDMAPNVITFKILKADAQEGDAVGAFIVLHESKPIYVPVIMTSGELKPMDLVYYKELNIFLPLSSQWLDEVSKMNLDEMGEGTTVPSGVPTDVDLTKIVIPPGSSTGRYGYASAEKDLDHGAKVMFKEALDSSYESPPNQFLDVIRKGPLGMLEGLKLAFERRPLLLQKLAGHYGVKALEEAFKEGYLKARMEKVAAAPPGFVKVATIDTPTEELKELFPEKMGEAFSSITKQGYAVHDSRAGITKIAVKVENNIRLDSPGNEAGYYKLFFLDGPQRNYFVIPHPVGVSDSRRRGPYVRQSRFQHHRQPIPYLVISTDGKEAWICDDAAGEKIFDSKEVNDSKIAKILKGSGGSTPKVNSFGFFIHNTDGHIGGTEPFIIGEVVKDGDRTKVRKRYGSCTIVIDDDPTRKIIDKVGKTGLIFLPKDSQWVSIVDNVKDNEDKPSDPTSPYSDSFEKHRRISVVNDPKLISRWMSAKLQEVGAPSVVVKKADAHTWWFSDIPSPVPVDVALPKLASENNISTADAAGILRDAQRNGQSYSFILGYNEMAKLGAELAKVAQPPVPAPTPQQAPQAPPPQGPPPQDPAMAGQDPAMMGQDPAMMGQDPAMMGMAPPASPVNPAELAIAEVTQQLAQQNELQQQQTQSQVDQLTQQMQLQQQANDMVVSVLQGIQQRTQEISNASGGQIPAEAMESPMAAGQMIAPTPGPDEMPPPMPSMDTESTMNPETVASQINPEMVDMVEDFQGQDVFDAGAVGMLSSAPILQEVVSSYVPNLEKSLDNLGRILLTLWLQEKDAKEQLGDEVFIGLEDKLRTVFKNMGDVILNINQNAIIPQSDAEQQLDMVSGPQG